MLFRHPLLALGHLVDKLRKPSDPVVTRDRKPQDA